MTLRVRLKYLGNLAAALVFMFGILTGMAGDFLALMLFRFAARRGLL